MNILLIGNYREEVGGISGQMALLQKHLRAEGHTADIFSTKGSVLHRLLAPIRLSTRAKQYDVVHIHCCSNWGFLPAVVGIMAARGKGPRIVLTYHGGGAEKFFAKHPKLVTRWLRRTDQNIVLSGFLAQVFDKHQIPYTVIPNIIELDGSHYRQRTPLQPHFICTRAHEAIYNIPCILRAFQQVQQQLPSATLTLVGDGTERASLEALADQMGLHNVTFTGRVPNNEIYAHLDHADILLSSPTVDNMPVSLLEAMNAGLLVISSRVGGVPYIVRNGRDGLLFESDNDHELATKMLWSIQNQTVAQAIVRQAQKTVDQYHWEHIRTEIYKAYGTTA